MTPKPPGLLVRYIKEGRCVVFVGAGLSAGAGLPPWKQLLLEVIKDMASSLPGGEREEQELRKLVGQGKLLEVADHCKERLGGSFHSLLTERLRGEHARIPETFRLLMRTPFAAWVTTNYDKLLERAWSEERGGYPRVLTHMDTEPLGRLLFDGGQFVLKAHGDIDRHGTVVLTSRDYADIIHANPSFNAVFSSLLLTRAVLFVGYSLADPDFRLLLDRQFTVFKGFVPDRFALMGGLGQVEQDVLWRTARIRVLPYPEGQHDEVLHFLRLLKDAVLPEAPASEAPPPPAAAALTPAPGTLAPVSAARPVPGAPPPAAAPAPPPSGAEAHAVEREPVVPSASWSARSVAGPLLESFQAGDEEASSALARPEAVEPYQLALGLRGGALQARLSRGESGLLTEGGVPLARLEALGRATAELVLGRAPGARALEAVREALVDCLPARLRRMLEEAVGAEGAPLVLRPEAPVERHPWELLSAQGELLALRCPLYRAPPESGEATRGLPRVRRPAHVLLASPRAPGDDELEGLESLYVRPSLALCDRLAPEQATADGVLERLEEGRFDVIHLAGPLGFEPSEVGLRLHGGGWLEASTLRPTFDRHPPALLVVSARFSAFLPSGLMAGQGEPSAPASGPAAPRWGTATGRDTFLRLASETGVGAFLGSLGVPGPEATSAFMRTLHQGLLEGHSIAQAVLQARVHTRQAFPEDATALLYVLSGAGGLRLA